MNFFNFSSVFKYAVMGAAGAIFLTGLADNELNAIQPDSYLNIEGGYRYDRITTKAEAFADGDFFLGQDKIKIKRLNIYEIGGKAQYRLCDYWFVKGSGYYGWSQGGRFHEKIEDYLCNEIHSESNVHKGRFRDASGSFGYLYPIDGYYGCWAIGPLVGYAWSDQRVHMGDVTTEGISNPALQNLQYYTRWSGPFMGGDMVYQLCDWKFTSGLEYHVPRWHGWYHVEQDIPGVVFSDRRVSSHAYGVVCYLDIEWEFWPSWHLGLGYKWQYWEAQNGRLKPKECQGSFTNVGFPLIDEVEIENSRWYSDRITLFIGADF